MDSIKVGTKISQNGQEYTVESIEARKLFDSWSTVVTLKCEDGGTHEHYLDILIKLVEKGLVREIVE